MLMKAITERFFFVWVEGQMKIGVGGIKSSKRFPEILRGVIKFFEVGGGGEGKIGIINTKIIFTFWNFGRENAKDISGDGGN